jgi:hypothetical protein
MLTRPPPGEVEPNPALTQDRLKQGKPSAPHQMPLAKHHVLGGHGPTEQVTLGEVAAQLPQQLQRISPGSAKRRACSQERLSEPGP